MDLTSVLLLLVLGTFTGFLAGLLGIGGGMIMVPFLTMILDARHFPADAVIKVAIATSLATILFTSLSSVRAHHRRGAVRWGIVATITLPSGAPLSIYEPRHPLARDLNG